MSSRLLSLSLLIEVPFSFVYMSVRIKYNLLLFGFWVSLIMSFFIKVYTIYPFLIEYFYSRELFVKISYFQRKLFGCVSFNFGDFFFILLFLFFLYIIAKMAILIWHRKYSLILNVRTFYFLFTIFFANYILFTLLWGMNFKREPITTTLHLDTIKQYQTKELAYLSRMLVKEINACVPITRLQQDKFKHFQAMVQQSSKDINAVSFDVFKDFDSIHYVYPSIKKSMIIFFMNKMGIAGYHNPFTGEAIINNSIPDFLKPAAMIHEIIHQMGFARESEANFISFLFAKKNIKDMVSYSIFMDLFISINNSLGINDQESAKLFIRDLDPFAQKHYNTFQTYYKKNKSTIPFLSDNTYNFFININAKSETGKQRELILLLLGYQSKVDRKEYLLLTQANKKTSK